jgi:acyl dehydratase
MPPVATFPPPDLVGRTAATTFEWTDRDVLLYALGVGAGQVEPLGELELTTENSAGAPLVVLPTFGVVVTQELIGMGVTEADPSAVVHAEQALWLHRPLPTSGSAHVEAQVVEVLDKGSGALVTVEATAIDARAGHALLTTRSAVFVRGAGGFGGKRDPSEPPLGPVSGVPDEVFVADTRPDQALLYRLSGDRHALHSDPVFAARAGFDRPILHGLATYGITGRILFNALCFGDPERFVAIEGRFTAPVFPGAQLVIRMWDSGGDEIRFRTETGDGTVVIDRGRLRLRR